MFKKIDGFKAIFSTVFLSVFFLFIIVYSLFLYTKYEETKDTLDFQANLYLHTKITEINTHLYEVAKQINIIELFISKNINENDHTHKPAFQHITNQFIIFMTDNELYQLRFVDTDGDELVKITRKENRLLINENIGNRSERYYFKAATKLLKDEIYISRLDLNVENGKVETPRQPVVRFVKPVFKNGEKFGYVIINYDMKRFLSSLKGNDAHINIMLLNKEGYYLSGMNKEDEFGFMFNDEKRTLKHAYPDVWAAIGQRESDQLIYNGFRAFYKKYNPVEAISPHRSFTNAVEWVVISYYERSKIIEILTAEFLSHLGLFLFALLSLVVFAYIITNLIISLRDKEKQLIGQANLAMMGEMISMIAHQWRQPLSSIAAIAAYMQLRYATKGEVEEEVFNKCMGDITSSVQLLSKTIDDFKNFYTSSDISEEVDLRSVIAKALAIVENMYKSQGITISVEHDGDFFNTQANERELIQVILNLLSNARDALMANEIESPEIMITTHYDDKYIYFSIEDNAGGIPEKIIDKIFEPYYSTKGKNGTGIGLYMVYLIVNRMNGLVKVKNSERGAKFTLAVPKSH